MLMPIPANIMSTFMSPLLHARGTPHRLVNRRTSGVLAGVVVAAVDSASRRRGLLGLERMPDDQALIIAPCSAIHTWFMRFPIDVLFVTRTGKIVKRCDGVRPWRLAIGWRAYAVVELAAGSLDAATRKGDIVEIVPAS
jgi:uncharacterized membrane protein (UPF0127 family)